MKTAVMSTSKSMNTLCRQIWLIFSTLFSFFQHFLQKSCFVCRNKTEGKCDFSWQVLESGAFWFLKMLAVVLKIRRQHFTYKRGSERFLLIFHEISLRFQKSKINFLIRKVEWKIGGRIEENTKKTGRKHFFLDALLLLFLGVHLSTWKHAQDFCKSQ